MKVAKQKIFQMRKHQAKANAFERALIRNEWNRGTNLYLIAAAFFDVDILNMVDMFKRLNSWGIKLFVYPHAARPNITYLWKDSIPHPFTEAYFVSGPGHIDVMRMSGVEKPVYDVGWSFCQQLPFQPAKDLKKVLFAPMHPNAPHLNHKPWLHDVDIATNRMAFERLLTAKKKMGFDLKVRHIYDITDNGLKYEDGVEYVAGRPDNNYKDIDEADLVVSTQTYAYLAIARGKPTVMMGENIPPKAGNSPESFEFIRDWEKIKHIMMYPLDINEVNDVPSLLWRASQTDKDIIGWKSRMIGEPFDEKKFVSIVNKHCGFME